MERISTPDRRRRYSADCADLCVADSFDAMTSKRCYKKAFPVEVAREKLLQDAGRQFDPDLVYKFVECLDNGSITLVKAEETVDNLKDML